MLQVQYAASNSSGTLASLIGWIDFGTTLSLSESSPKACVTNAIAGGYCISFDISLCVQSNLPLTSPVVLSGTTTPLFSYTPFGNTAYSGIPGNVALSTLDSPTTNTDSNITLTLRDIVVEGPDGQPIEDYFIVAADSEITNQCRCSLAETWSLTTNGSDWELLDAMPATNDCASRIQRANRTISTTSAPRVSGINTPTVTETGTTSCPENTSANAFITESPTQITANANTNDSTVSFSFGVIIPKPKCDHILSTVRPSKLNYVRPCESTVFTFPLKCGDRPLAITHNGINYPFNSSPILITGHLGTYLFYSDYVLYNGTPNASRNNFDIFTLSFQRCSEHGTKIIIFASKTHSY